MQEPNTRNAAKNYENAASNHDPQSFGMARMPSVVSLGQVCTLHRQPG